MGTGQQQPRTSEPGGEGGVNCESCFTQILIDLGNLLGFFPLEITQKVQGLFAFGL